MPNLHEKTHFKSAKTIGLALPSSLFTSNDQRLENEMINIKQAEIVSQMDLEK
jgi:hypothetical protein